VFNKKTTHTVKQNISHKFKLYKILIAVLVLLAVAGLALFVLEKTHTTDFIKQSGSQSPNPVKPTAAQQAEADAQSKQQLIDSATKSDQSSTPDTTTAPAPSAGSLTISASQSDTMSVVVFTKMQDVPAGTCKLIITNGAATSSQTAGVIYQPQFSSCAGFTVPVSSVGAGNWNISVTVSVDGGKSLTQKTELVVH